VTVPLKRAAFLSGGALLVLAVLAALVLHLMPSPHRPFEYMIAGTAATGVALAVVFAILNRRTEARTQRVSRAR
jgi:Kef-type K+ transport system membrane component KefB